MQVYQYYRFQNFGLVSNTIQSIYMQQLLDIRRPLPQFLQSRSSPLPILVQFYISFHLSKHQQMVKMTSQSHSYHHCYNTTSLPTLVRVILPRVQTPQCQFLKVETLPSTDQSMAAARKENVLWFKEDKELIHSSIDTP